MHDVLCLEFDNNSSDGFDHSSNSPFCYCDLIIKVRDHIASKIVQYGKDTHNPHDPRIPCQRCDIVAAYNYAAEIAKGK